MFYPLFESPDPIKSIRPVASPAMGHSGNHKQPVGTAHLRRAAERVRDAVVVIDAVQRRDQIVVPSVILNQLAAMPEERLEIRIPRVNRPALTFQQRDIAVEVERPIVPFGVFEYTVLQTVNVSCGGCGLAA